MSRPRDTGTNLSPRINTRQFRTVLRSGGRREENSAIVAQSLKAETSITHSTRLARTVWTFATLIWRDDLDGRGYTSHQAHAIWCPVNLDAYRNALGKTHPSEDRI